MANLPKVRPVGSGGFLKVDDLWAGYGRVPVVRGVSLDLVAGESLCLVGPNGAGKTTLIRSISGLLRPTGGSLMWLGESATGRSAHWLAKRGFVHVPEGAGAFSGMTVRDNLEIPLHALGRRPRPDNFARIYDLFPELKLRDKQVAVTLSGGEQRMLAIARGLIVRPLAMILDEPSLGLSPVMVSRVASAMRELSRSGTAVVIAEQNLAFAEEVADRAVLMNRGQFTWNGYARELRSVEAVRHTVLGIGISSEVIAT